MRRPLRITIGGEDGLIIERLLVRAAYLRQDVFRMVRGVATTLSLRALAVVEDVLTPGASRASLGQSALLRRLLRRRAHRRTSRKCLPPAFPTSSVPPTWLRRLGRLAGPVPRCATEVVVSDCLADVLRTVDAPATLPSLAYRAVAKNCPPAITGHPLDHLPDHLPDHFPDHLLDHLLDHRRIIIARVSAMFRVTSMRHTQLYTSRIFASIGKLGTGRRRRTAR